MADDSQEKNPFNDLSVSAKEYFKLKVDEYKLRGIEGLSVLFNTVFFIMIASIVAGVALQMLGLAAGYAMGEILGSNAAGFCSVGGFFIAIVLVLYILRKKLFINQLIKMFIKLFFEQDGESNIQ